MNSPARYSKHLRVITGKMHRNLDASFYTLPLIRSISSYEEVAILLVLLHRLPKTGDLATDNHLS